VGNLVFKIGMLLRRNILAAVAIFLLIPTSANSCVKPEKIKDLSSYLNYLNPSQDLNQTVKVSTPIGHVFNIPVGYLSSREMWKPGQEYSWKGVSYYFCFPSGGYSVPDMESYFGVALQEYDAASLPVRVNLTEFDPKQYDPKIPDSGRTTEQNVENLKQLRKPSASVIWSHEFGLLKITSQTDSGDFVDYASDNDPIYNVIASTSSPYFKGHRESIVMEIYNRNTGLYIYLHMPLTGLPNWQKVVEQVAKHLKEWSSSKQQ
jgi:hypothetical protein